MMFFLARFANNNINSSKSGLNYETSKKMTCCDDKKILVKRTSNI